MIPKIGKVSLSLIAVAGMLLSGCSDDTPATPTPGVLTEQEPAIFTRYNGEGEIKIPVNAENPDCFPEVEKFTIDNISFTGSGDLSDDVPGFNVPEIISVVRGRTSDYVIVMEYSFAGDATVSFTLGYSGTKTAIPVSIICHDALSLSASHLVPGTTGVLSLQCDPSTAPPEIADHFSISRLDVEAHAADVSAEVMTGGKAVALTLGTGFSLTPEESEAGYAIIPVQATVVDNRDNNSFIIREELHVCPSEGVSSARISASETSHAWGLKEVAEALGMEKRSDGLLYFGGREVTFFIASKGEPLQPVEESDYMVYPGLSDLLKDTVDPSGGNIGVTDTVNIPQVKLMGMKYLPAGEYDFVVHISKSYGDGPHYVDIYLPFIKE